MVVPSVAFLAESERWVAVVFAEHGDVPLEERISGAEPAGWCRLETSRRTPQGHSREEPVGRARLERSSNRAGVAAWRAWTGGWVRVGRA